MVIGCLVRKEAPSDNTIGFSADLAEKQLKKNDRSIIIMETA
jgi:hypothetical protein